MRDANAIKLCMLVAGIAACAFANPLQFAEYEQEVTAEFATAEAAKSATLEATDLPDGCERAFTSRWDDSTAAHIAKGKMLAGIGVWANFYLNGGDCPFLKTHAKQLLEMGHALGNHSFSHPQLTEIPANEVWRELLEEKIAIESVLGAPCVAFAAPFNWGPTLDADRHPLMIRILQATGHYVCDDFPVLRDGYDCATNAWFETGRFGANDRKPSKEEFEKQLANAERILKGKPWLKRVTFGVHSWCDDKGTETQREVLTETLAKNPGWYRCHANRFGAHRYSARFAQIEKVECNGKKATWRVKRYDPVDLGDGIALSVRFSEKPVKCGLKEGMNGTYALEHTRPVSFSPASASNVAVTLRTDAARGKLRVRVENKSKEALEAVRVTACLPPKWKTMRRIAELRNVPARGFREAEFDLGEEARKDYAEGDALYAACADYMRGGERERAWGTFKEPGGKPRTDTPRDACLVMGPFDEKKFNEADWIAASKPGAELPDIGTAENEKWISLIDPSRMATTVYVNMPYGSICNKKYREASKPFVGNGGARLFALEFVAESEGEGEIYASFNPRFRSPVVYLNGERIPFTGSPKRVVVRKGVNRIVARADLVLDKWPTSEQLTVCRGGLGSPFSFRRIREPASGK